jgi:hypothetical protein
MHEARGTEVHAALNSEDAFECWLIRSRVPSSLNSALH